VDAAVALVGEMAVNPDVGDIKRMINLEAESGYRLAPLIMPRLMASPTVARSRGRYAGNG